MLHFFDVGWRMKIVGVKKSPAEALSHPFANGGLPAPVVPITRITMTIVSRVARRASGAAQNQQRNFRRYTEAYGRTTVPSRGSRKFAACGPCKVVACKNFCEATVFAGCKSGRI
jgi:hypothetical protein